MNIPENIKNFIQDHAEEIDNNDFSSIYNSIDEDFALNFYEVGELTKLFLLSGINPLDYMKWVPSNFLRSVKDIDHINIPNNIEEIDMRAFLDTDLKSIKLPSNLISMGEYCFACSGIIKIKIPSKVSIIGQGTFQQCYNLKNVIFETTNIFKLVPHLFENCSSLTNIKLPDNLTGIGYACFADCKNLAIIDLPSTINNIDNKAFIGCLNLKQINIPSLVSDYLAIDNNVFLRCSKLREINFGGTMKEWIAKTSLGAQNKEIKQQCIIKCIDGNLKYDYNSSGWGQI